MAGRGLGSLLVAAIALGCCAPAALANDGQRLVLVEHSEAMIEALETKGFDVGYVTDHTEAAVYVDDAAEARLRVEGYRIGDMVASQHNFEERKAEISATTAAEALAAEVATKGLTKSAKAQGAVNVPGKVVIQRSYTFSNYAGRFLYVEAHNKDHTDTTGPAMSFTYTGPNGTSQVYNFGNSITPDGGDSQIGGNKLRDIEAGAGSQYMYHRGLVLLRGADANLQANQISVRVADSNGAFDTATPTEWTAKALPPRVAGFQKDFITKYMDPTEVYNRMDQLTAEFKDLNIIEAINLPHKTDGYQRQALATMEGNTVQPQNNPANQVPGHPSYNAAQEAAAQAAAASRARTVQLFSKALGHQGGNNITAEFKAPPAGTANAPMSVTVTDGTWTEHDPDDADASDGIRQITVPTKDIVVNLPTDANGALTATAAQVKAAINADPAASQLVTAYTYAGPGEGIVQPTPVRNYNVPAGTTNTPTVASSKVRLSDYLRGGSVYWTGSGPTEANPAGTLARTDSRYITKGPFQPKVYRIGKDRSNNAVGVYLYCQQHAREWVTPITCVETAERLVRNYATDPTTKEYVDKLNIFILPSVNPDGGHSSFHDFSAQRRNMKKYCNDPEAFVINTGATSTTVSTSGAVGNRNAWGVDLNRNNTVGSLFDGYVGASSACTSDVFAGPSEASEPEIKNEHWIIDTFKGIKFSNNIHTHGGYFMWSPGSYKFEGRETLPAPNIGEERYFFDVADTILSHIRSHRNTAILPQRVGPVADVLYSAAGLSSDEHYYSRGIIAYSFEAGAQRIAVNSTTGAISRTAVGFQPCFAGPGTNGGQGATCTTGGQPNPLMVNEGHDSTMEFAEGNFGMIQGALEYHEDNAAPQTTIEYSAAQTSGEPINFRFNWVTEPSVIYYTTDGSNPVIAPNDPATPADESCANTSTTGTRCYNNQGPRMPGEVLTLGLGAHTVKWISKDIKGNVEAMKSQRLLVAADDADGTVGGNVPATLGLTLGTAAAFEPFVPGVPKTYTASTVANVISTAGSATLSVSDGGANPGHLMNGTFKMPQALQATASSLGGTAAAGGAVSAAALPLLNYSAPVSNDSVTVQFKQAIGATDALRTGNYTKSLTFTLSTTNP